MLSVDVACCFRCVFLVVCVNLGPKTAISRGEQNRYGWRRRILLTARLIKFYGGLRLMKSTAAYGGLRRRLGALKSHRWTGNTVICSSARQRLNIWGTPLNKIIKCICNFFGTVFCIETDDNYDPLPETTVFKESTSILVTEDDVLERLSKWNINKSEGPDLMHPRIIYELRNVVVYEHGGTGSLLICALWWWWSCDITFKFIKVF